MIYIFCPRPLRPRAAKDLRRMEWIDARGPDALSPRGPISVCPPPSASPLRTPSRPLPRSDLSRGARLRRMPGWGWGGVYARSGQRLAPAPGQAIGGPTALLCEAGGAAGLGGPRDEDMRARKNQAFFLMMVAHSEEILTWVIFLEDNGLIF